MEFQELILKYREATYDLSCSESTIYAANEAYQLGLNQSSLKMMAGFSGGMMREELCGVVAGGIATLSVLFTEDVAHKSPVLKEIISEYLHTFDLFFKTTNCKQLKLTHRDMDNNTCNPIIFKNVEILESLIKKYYNHDK
jgi:C_GCAxxG_C_C family probable redox protein